MSGQRKSKSNNVKTIPNCDKVFKAEALTSAQPQRRSRLSEDPMGRSMLAELDKLGNACYMQNVILDAFGPDGFDDIFGSGVDWEEVADKVCKDLSLQSSCSRAAASTNFYPPHTVATITPYTPAASTDKQALSTRPATSSISIIPDLGSQGYQKSMGDTVQENSGLLTIVVVVISAQSSASTPGHNVASDSGDNTGQGGDCVLGASFVLTGIFKFILR